MRKKLTALLAVLMVLTVFLSAGCSSKKTREGITLTVGITDISGNFNPLYYSAQTDGYVVDLIFDKLVDYDINGNIVPGDITEKFDYADEGRDIIFRLKDDIKFSDGVALTAQDVVFTYKALAAPGYSQKYSEFMSRFAGYESYSEGQTDDFAGVEAVGEDMVIFHFKDALRTNIEACMFQVMPAHYYGKEFDGYDYTYIQELNTVPLGSGPYMLDEMTDEDDVWLVYNPHNTAADYPAEIIHLKLISDGSGLNGILSGELDLVCASENPEEIAQAQKEKGVELSSYTRSGYGYVAFNCDNDATADTGVRQALCYAMNVGEFVTDVFANEQQVELAKTQAQPFSANAWFVDDELNESLNSYSYDIDMAGRLLDEAGWLRADDGWREKDGKKMVLKIAALEENKSVDKLVTLWQRNWESALGIKLEIDYYSVNTLLDLVMYKASQNVADWNVCFFAQSMTSNDPDMLYSTFASSGIGGMGDNICRYNSSRVDELLLAGRSVKDRQSASQYYKKLAQVLNEEVPLLPVYTNVYYDMYGKRLSDFETTYLFAWTKALKYAKLGK